jgi:carboxylesterase
VVVPDLFTPLAAPFRLDGSNGEAVVLTHGFTGVPAHFRPLAEFLHGKGYTVNVPLLAGHGTSPTDMAGTGADDWIRSVRQAAGAVSDHRRVHLAGLSMGGLLSIIVAKDVAASTVTTINSPILVKNKRLYLTPVAHHFVAEVSWPEAPTPPLDPEVADYWLTYDGYHTASAAELVRVMRTAYLAARRLRRPSLVIQSRTDESVDPRSARLLANALGPKCDLVWLERSIHNALLDSERDVIHRAVLGRIGTV